MRRAIVDLKNLSSVYVIVVLWAATSCISVMLKITLVQALKLCTGCTAHMGSRGIALPFPDHGTRRG
jgi:hypothetical protein